MFKKFLIVFLLTTFCFSGIGLAAKKKKHNAPKFKGSVTLNGFKYKMIYISGGNFKAKLKKGQKIPSGKNIPKQIELYITGNGDLWF